MNTGERAVAGDSTPDSRDHYSDVSGAATVESAEPAGRAESVEPGERGGAEREEKEGILTERVGSANLTPGQKVDILLEALPYIRKFAGKVVVIKYGGNAMPATGGVEESRRDYRDSLAAFADDVVLMRSTGMCPVVVHGGGPQIDEVMSRLGKVPEFKDGRRVTDAETLEIARMVLVGKVNREIVSALNVHGAVAVGLSGEDARLITASARAGDLGYVGDVKVVDPTVVKTLVNDGLIPVVATTADDQAGQGYNINADSVAGALAAALDAEKLVFLTDVEGIRAHAEESSTIIRALTAGILQDLIDQGRLVSGMLPKGEACLHALRSGVRYAHILDGRVPHVMLLEFFTDKGIGTMITPHDEGAYHSG
ncbi:MAG: acetylglutamate kinase [Actinobacteria bacterium]|nr:acetylglutamate kinase [Actinomycetota bacterium]MCL5446176.1 acetylglutamate kinase [Actinomycetota bacterium]